MPGTGGRPYDGRVTTLRLALLQIAPCGTDVAANLEKGESACRRAAELRAHLALFPEMWSIGYQFPGEDLTPEQWQALATDTDSDFVKHCRRLAAELDMAIAITYLERWPGAPRNTVSLIDRLGQMALTYAKVHTCDFDKEAALTPGDAFSVCDLETRAGVVRTGAMICYDREFPESARVLMLEGAELVLVPNSCEMEVNRLSQLRARAYENMTAMAMTNYPAPKCNGHSLVFDGMACNSEESMRDMLVVEAGGGRRSC